MRTALLMLFVMLTTSLASITSVQPANAYDLRGFDITYTAAARQRVDPYTATITTTNVSGATNVFMDTVWRMPQIGDGYSTAALTGTPTINVSGGGTTTIWVSSTVYLNAGLSAFRSAGNGVPPRQVTWCNYTANPNCLGGAALTHVFVSVANLPLGATSTVTLSSATTGTDGSLVQARHMMTATAGSGGSNLDTYNATLFSNDVGGIVYSDADGSGGWTSVDTVIPGVVMELWVSDAAGNPLAKYTTTSTNSGGVYTFPNVPDGTYVTKLIFPADKNRATRVWNESTMSGIYPDEISMPFTVSNGTDQTSVDYALMYSSPTATLSIVPTLSTGGSFAVPGTVITYRFNVTNTGNVAIHGVNVSAPLVGMSGATCTPASITNGQTSTCTATYTVTAEDIDRGYVQAAAAAYWTDPWGVSNSTSVFRTTMVHAGVIQGDVFNDINANGSGDADGDPGYAGVTVELWTAVDGVPTTRVATTTTDASGAFNFGNRFAGTYIVRVVKPTANSKVTRIMVPGGNKYVDGTPTDPGTDSHQFNLNSTTGSIAPKAIRFGITEAVASQTLTGTAYYPPGRSGFAMAGDQMRITYWVNNTGVLTIRDAVVTDPAKGINETVCQAAISPGTSANCSFTYTVTEADVAAGSVTLNLTVNSVDSYGNQVAAATRTFTFPTGTPSLTVEKVAQEAGPYVPDQTITWDYVVSNPGNTTVTGIQMYDDHGLTFTCPSTSLAAGASMTCTATGVLSKFTDGVSIIPVTPRQWDPCNAPGTVYNARWLVGSGTDRYYWDQSEDGHLWARTQTGYVFPDGSTEHYYGQAAEDGWACSGGSTA